MKFTNGAITPNVTAFGSPLGRKKRQKKSRGVVDRNPFWYEDAALGRIVTRIPWADTLSWLGYDSRRRWSYAVRADADFDVVAFLSPIGIGFVMLIALVGGKYLQHPDLQGFFGGLSTVITITIAFSYNISFLQSSIGLVMGSLAIGFAVYRSIGPTIGVRWGNTDGWCCARIDGPQSLIKRSLDWASHRLHDRCSFAYSGLCGSSVGTENGNIRNLSAIYRVALHRPF